MKTTYSIRMDSRLRAKLERFSKSQKVPSSELVRQSLERYLAVQEFRRLRGKVLPFAEAEGLLTDEDVFKALK
jgi:predicted transcriptional regulator